MATPRTVRPRKNEIEPLQSAMRDVQVSIADYYRLTSGFIEDPAHFTTPVRATVAFIQKLNDVFRSDFGQRDRFKTIFRNRLAAGDRGAETIEAIRYVRNVGSHQIYPVQPSTARIVGNHRLGYRTSALWEPIASAVHRKTHPSTQALKPHYDQHLQGRPVLDSFLDAARFFWEVCPLVVDRDEEGEWTGFPLRHQAGVGTRLHPEEPEASPGDQRSNRRARRWLETRLPGGSARLVCGRVTVGGQPHVVGLTFRGRASYSPFTECPEQVLRDLAMGFTYYGGLPGGQLSVAAESPDYGGVFPSHIYRIDELATWAGPRLTRPPSSGDYSTFGGLHDYWPSEVLKAVSDRLVYREQRLAAWFPIR